MAKKKVSRREAGKRHQQVVMSLAVLIQQTPHGFTRGDAVTNLTAKRNH